MDEDEIWEFCKPTFMMVILFGLGVYLTHRTPELSEDSSLSKQERGLASASEVLSLKEASEADVKTENNTRALQLNCLKKLTKPVRLETKVSQLRITGKECGEQYLRDQIKIENSTNGFEASLFLKGSKGFSTDYLTLDKGTNALKVIWANNNETKVLAEVLIQRSY